MEKSGEHEQRAGVPEPRPGLWYGDIQGINPFRTHFWARQVDSMDQEPPHMAEWRFESFSKEDQALLVPGKQFWWDAEAGKGSTATVLDSTMFGFFPVDLITQADVDEAQLKAAELLKYFED